MIWKVANKGFSPSCEPITSLPITNYKNTELVITWENLAHNIPHYIKEECLREEMIYTLRKSDTSYYHGFIDSFESPAIYERIFLILSYFANAYVNAPEGRRKTKLPKEITIPLARISHLVGRQPVLDYTAYILYNKNPLTFTGSKEEELFIKTFAEIESTSISWHDAQLVRDQVFNINKILKKTLDSIDRFFIKQFFRNFSNLFYEGWREDRQTYPSDILFQSPLLNCLHNYLDIHHKNDYLKKQSEQWKLHSPSSHVNYVQNIKPIGAADGLLEEYAVLCNNFLKITKDGISF